MTPEDRLTYLLKVFFLFAIYFVSAWGGLQLDAVSGFATLVWPPTGLALAALLIFGYGLWPGITLGAFLVNLVTGAPPLVALGIGLGNTLEALVGAYLLKSLLGFRNQLGRTQDVVGFIALAALFATTISATLGVSFLVVGGVAPPTAFWPTWTAWWVGDVLGALVVAPILLTWGSRPRLPVLGRSIVEVAGLLALLVAISLVIFWDVLGPRVADAPLIYLTFLPLIWAALRFGQPGAAAATFVVSALAVAGAVLGFGPFIRATLSESLLYLQSFMGVVAVTMLILAAAVSEREEAEESARESGARFRALVEHSSDVVALINPVGIVRYVSPSGKHIFGYDEKEVVGKSGFSFIHPNDRGRTMMILANLVLRPGRVVTTEFRLKHKNGSWRWVEAVGNNLLLEPAVRAIVVNYRDITERKAVDEAKSDFVTLASHQLRTPLTTINWYAESLLSKHLGVLSKKQERYLAEVYRGSRRMVDLVNALLNISRIELGTFMVKPQPTDVVAVGKSVLQEFKKQIAEKKLVIESDFARQIPPINVDPKLLRIVFQNLLSNAVKYTPPRGRVTFTISRRFGAMKITVVDTGYGIPKEDLPKLFTKLFRADNVKERDTEGSGLGLYITKAIVDLSGGNIRCTSQENKGTTFEVTLPMKGMPKKAGATTLQEMKS